MARPIIRDGNGELIDYERLTREEGGPSITGVRQPMPEHPSFGLSPEGLASILLESESQDPSRYYALLDDVQEKELHYRGVLWQRRAALAQLPVTVNPPTDDAKMIDMTDAIRAKMLLPEMSLTRFDLSNATHMGVAPGEIIWDTSEKQWDIKAVKYREPRFFRYDRTDLTTPLLLDDQGQPQPLAPFKWIWHRARLTSGIPVRDGLGRGAVWAWMFKNFDVKSWLIFLDKYGQPLRYGTYPTGTPEPIQRRLLRALRDLGRDAAGIIPEGMNIVFEKADASGTGQAFKDMANYFDEQLSKLVLGQTGTSDASKGGYAVGKVHEGVKDSIALYDGLALAVSLNRDFVRPYIDLNYGPQKAYPTVLIGLGDMRNAEMLIKNMPDFIDRGLPVEASQVYPLFGLTEPAKGKDVVLLRPATRPAAGPGDRAGLEGPAATPPATLSAEVPADDAPHDSFDDATLQVLNDLGWRPDVTALQAALAKCKTAEEGRAVLRQFVDKLGTETLADALARSRFVSRMAGDTGA